MRLGLREWFLTLLVSWGTALALVTELLGACELVKQWPIVAAWVLAVVLAVWRFPRPVIVFRWQWLEGLIAVAIAAIAAILAFTAIVAAPNSADAMAYHLPRVIYWAQQSSVEFFPTPYFNQIMLQPLAEYAMLHGYLITGGDGLVNLVQWIGYCGSVVGVSLIGREMGLNSRGQAITALFAATLPNGVLQASGAKNDYFLAMWLTATVFFALRKAIWRFALALALALGTKATAYLFAPPILAYCLWRSRANWLRAAVATAACVALINGPQYIRNLRLSGSPLGFDSAQGDGFFRWRNEPVSLGAGVSNLLRNTSDQLGSRNPEANRAVYDAVVQLHEWLHLDPQDPATTWRWSVYSAPRNANHEADANNRWHLLILVAAFIAAVAQARRDPQWLIYALALAVSFFGFCLYLKWQPFLARLLLGLFVLSAPLGGWIIARLRWPFIQILICIFLVSTTRLPLTENWTRPLKGERSILHARREDVYFYDMGQWGNQNEFLEAVRLTLESGCSEIGIDVSEFQLEYPYQVLVRAGNPQARFQHTGVQNTSTRFRQPEPKPCAVFCPDCAGNDAKFEIYRRLGRPHTIGRFLLFLSGRG